MRLHKITEKCRPDMHEPDEQGISADVVGTHLDNAMGDGPPPTQLWRVPGEDYVERALGYY